MLDNNCTYRLVLISYDFEHFFKREGEGCLKSQKNRSKSQENKTRRSLLKQTCVQTRIQAWIRVCFRRLDKTVSTIILYLLLSDISSFIDNILLNNFSVCRGNILFFTYILFTSIQPGLPVVCVRVQCLPISAQALKYIGHLNKQ